MNNNTTPNIIVEFTDDHIIPASSLAVVGALLGKSDFAKKYPKHPIRRNFASAHG